VPRPLISVVLPVYNAEATLRRALASVFAQDDVDLDVVVCNDGSTDATSDILSEYRSRIVVVSQENRGRGAARNACLGRARGNLIALLDADDWWPAGKLAMQVADVEQLPQTGVFYGNAYVVNGSGQIYRSMNGEWHVGHSGWVFPFLVRQNFVPMPTVVVRRSVVTQAGLFDETLKRSQDLEWLLRLSTVTPFHYSSEMLAFCDDRNWGSAEKRIDTYACYRALLEKTEARFPALAVEHRHAFAKSYSDASSEVGSYHEQGGRFGDAACAYAAALEHTPRSRPLQRRLALARHRSGDPAAFESYRSLLEDDPYDQEARFYLGTILLTRQKDEDARQALETALYDGYLYQKFPECLNNLAVACARLGDVDRARELLTQAIVQQDFYSDAIGNLHALDADGDPSTLKVTSRRVFQ
jgi:glycosyltransferase involved in cell wall biosynthesis